MVSRKKLQGRIYYYIVKNFYWLRIIDVNIPLVKLMHTQSIPQIIAGTKKKSIIRDDQNWKDEQSPQILFILLVVSKQ